MTPSEKIAAIRRRRAAVKASGRRLPRRKKPPRQIYPHGLEREYERAVLRVTEPFFESVRQLIERDLPAIVATRDEALRTDAAYGEMIGETIGAVRINVARRVTEASGAEVSESFARRVAEFNRTQVDRQFSTVLGIAALRQERWLEDKLSAFVTGNVELIKDITEKGASDVSKLLMARVEAGDSNRTIAKAVRERLEITKRRAQFIARDQVAKLNGKLTELRQKEAGVEAYIWRAVKDGATRASHLQNDGKRFRWDSPPATGHPGEDYQCRCTAEPVLDEFIEAPVSQAA